MQEQTHTLIKMQPQTHRHRSKYVSKKQVNTRHSSNDVFCLLKLPTETPLLGSPIYTVSKELKFISAAPLFLELTYLTVISGVCFSVSVSRSTWDRLASRSAMPVGSCTAWSMVSSLMDRCPATRLSEVVMTPSTLSSVRPDLESMCLGQCSSTLSQQLLVGVIPHSNLTIKIAHQQTLKLVSAPVWSCNTYTL